MASSFKPKDTSSSGKIANQEISKKRISVYSTLDSVDNWERRFSKINPTRRHSKDSILKLNKIRCDFYGQEIVKGGKTHKVSFADVVYSQSLAEIFTDYSEKSKEPKAKSKRNQYCNSDCLLF